MNDFTFLDRLRTRVRLFLMGNREFVALLGIVVLSFSVIYSTKIITFPTRVPTRATESAPGGPAQIVTPTSRIPTIITPQGFLELLQLSPTEPAPSTESGGPSPTPSLTPTPTVSPTPTPSASGGTIFLPPVQR